MQRSSSTVKAISPLTFAYVICICLWLGGCGVNPISPEVEERSSPAPIERDISPPAETLPAVSSSAATESLLLAATEAAEQRNHESAIVYLERAVRIEPRNAELWLRLSAEYLANGELNAALQHNRKAIALAAHNDALQRQAWLQMADIEQARGNFSEAQSLRRRWGPVRG